MTLSATACGNRKQLDETHKLISAGLAAIPGLRDGVDTGLSHIDVKGGSTPIVRAEARRKADSDSKLDADDHPNFRRFQSAEKVAMSSLNDFARRHRPATDSGVLSSLQPPRTTGRKRTAPYRAAELERTIRVKGVDRLVPKPADRGGQRRKVYAATEFLALWHLGTPKKNRGALTTWAISNERIPVHKSQLEDSQQAGLDARGVTLSASASSVSASLVANNHAGIGEAPDGGSKLRKLAEKIHGSAVVALPAGLDFTWDDAALCAQPNPGETTDDGWYSVLPDNTYADRGSFSVFSDPLVVVPIQGLAPYGKEDTGYLQQAPRTHLLGCRY